jgi:hypothetical protein
LRTGAIRACFQEATVRLEAIAIFIHGLLMQDQLKKILHRS